MEKVTTPQQRRRPPFRRLLAVALSGGLGVFAFAVDAPLLAKQGGPAPPTNISSIDQQES
jgi:hypothetical protein